MNTEQVLIRLKLDPESRTKAVQQVRIMIEESPQPLAAAKVLFDNLTPPNTAFNFTDSNEARLAVAYLVQDAIVLGERYDPEDALLKAAKHIAKAHIDRPWAFAKDEVAEEGQVIIKADGKIKKGGKQIMAQALFLENATLDNKALIKLFMEKLDMSEAGARTYVYNVRKAAK